MLADLCRLHKNITWHASSEHEAEDITRIVGQSLVKIGSPIGDQKRIITASDLVATEVTSELGRNETSSRTKQAGCATIGFVSRISPMKNLEFALEVMAGVRSEVRFEIYGPAEDQGYWKKCQRLLLKLPPNVKTTVHGEISHQKVHAVLQTLHLLLLPTRGENFGHIINEALSAGCPVLISNQTPWRNLAEKRAGWDLPLDDIEAFRRAIEEVVVMDSFQFKAFSESAAAFARNRPREGKALEQNRRMFEDCLRLNGQDDL